MNIGTLVTQIETRELGNNNRIIGNKPIGDIKFKHNLNKLETGKAVFRYTHDLYGEDVPEFYVLLIDLFDRAMYASELHVLSTEQEKLLSNYFKDANTLTRQHTDAELQDYIEDEISDEEYVKRWLAISRLIRELDRYLGSYLGQDVDKYTRYYNKYRNNLTDLRFSFPTEEQQKED